MRPIDADRLAEKKFPNIAMTTSRENVAYCKGWNDVIDTIVKHEPSVKMKTGQWVDANESHPNIYYCSSCGNEAYWDTDYGQQLFDYCPYCGSYNKMKFRRRKL